MFKVFLLFLVSLQCFAQSTWQNDILMEVENIFSPLSEKMNKKFVLEVKKDPTSAAAAEVTTKEHKLIINDSLLKNYKLTPDILRITVCHELGHIFGGSPRRNIPYEWDGLVADDGLSLVSSEGQSDFYATASCFRRLVKHQNHREVLKRLKVDPFVQHLCNKTWRPKSEAALICQRSAMASLGFLKLNFEFDISFNSPDLNETSRLIRNEYPARQCRLDTLLKGSLCKSQNGIVFDFINSEKNECLNLEGKRPRCWYKSELKN